MNLESKIVDFVGHEVEIFQLSDGRYAISKERTVQVAGTQPENLSKFLASELGMRFTKSPTSYRVISLAPEYLITIDVAVRFWVWEITEGMNGEGNGITETLAFCCMKETLEYSCVRAFGLM